MSPLIKVCGMTEAENIRNVELQGVDMIGFIFYPKSPRCLCQMPGYLPACAKRVGVFVNESKENILMYTDRFSLDYIQLHGNEAPEYCRSLRNAGLHLITSHKIPSPTAGRNQRSQRNRSRPPRTGTGSGSPREMMRLS